MIKKYIVAASLCFGFVTASGQSRIADRDTFADIMRHERQASRSPGLLQQAVMKMLGRNKLFLSKNDVDVLLGGRVRQEGFYFDKPLTFRDDYNDEYMFCRSKYNIDLGIQYGRTTYGSPVVDAQARITFFDVWDNLDVYTPVVQEPVSFSPQHFLKKAEIGEHHHDGAVTHGFLEDGWLELHLDKMLVRPDPIPVSLRLGYFKQKIGRGVSLGTYFDGAINYLGWQTPGNPGNNTNSSPGVMLTIGNPQDCALELYYSKWKKRSHGPDFTREVIKAKRLDIDPASSGNQIQRGVHADRDLVSARLMYHHSLARNGSLYLEPYMVYVNAPELEIEFEGDASARIATFGCMAEYKRNGWKFNCEVAGQVGHEDVFAIDRNHTVLDDDYYAEPTTLFYTGDLSTAEINTLVQDAIDNDDPAPDGMIPQFDQAGVASRYDAQIGFPRKYQSHILVGMRKTTGHADEQSEFTPYRAYYVNNEVRHINKDRTLSAQGDFIRTTAPENDKDMFISGQVHKSNEFGWENSLSITQGGLYGGKTFKSGIDYFDNFIAALGIKSDGMLHNANVPFGAGKRFRKGYRLSCRGLMAMADLSYTFPSKRLKLATAVAYVSGDDYPFNTEENKQYDGFIPFKDADYTGHSVMSYAMLAARKIGRPTTFSDNLLHAPINYESITNLTYLGAGFVWHPLEKRHELRLEGNVLHFWQPSPPFKWDTQKTRDFGSSKMNELYAKAQDDLHFTGHESRERASKNLGLEVNLVTQWRPIEALQFEVLLATFVPGKLYSDIAGMPSALTIRHDKEGDWRFDGFGTKVPIGGMARLTYWF